MKSVFDRPRLLLTLASVFWASNVVLARWLGAATPPISLAFLRWGIATLILLPFALPHLKKEFGLILKNWRILLFLGITGPAIFNTLSYLGLVSTEAINGLVLNAAGPMFIALAAWSIFGDRLGLSQLIGMVTGFVGVILIIAKGDLSSLQALRFNPGDLLFIAGTISWGVYTAFLRKRPAISWQSYNLVTYAVAAAANVPFVFVEYQLGGVMTVNWLTISSVVVLAIFPSLLAYIFYNRAVEQLGPAAAGLYLFLIPIFGALLAMLSLGERPHLFHLIGFALIIAGVVIGSRSGVKRLRVSGPADQIVTEGQ